MTKALCLAALLLLAVACSEEAAPASTPTPEPTDSPKPTATLAPAATSTPAAGNDLSVSRENPGQTERPFDRTWNDALADAQPLGLVEWDTPPSVPTLGTMTAAGSLLDGARLSNPMVDGEGASFILYHKDVDEPLAVLLPDLGGAKIWGTDLTVATLELTSSGSAFTFEAYSPLFFDFAPADLELRVFGYDAGTDPALLAVSTVE